MADVHRCAPRRKRRLSRHAYLLADKQVVPEFIQHEAKPSFIVKALQALMDDAKVRDRMISEFDAIVGKLGGSGASGASDRAARAIIQELNNGRSPDRAGDPEIAARWAAP